MAAEPADIVGLAPVVPLPDHGVVVVTASTIEPRSIRWLWDGFLAHGKLQLLAGPVGTGKTALALAFAATITTGGFWPDGTQARQANVLIYAGEDDLEDTIVPRLQVAGADLSRVFLVSGVREKDGVRRFDPSRDASALRTKLKAIDDIALVVVDPVISIVKGSSNDSLDVRRSLEVLLEIADDTGAAILGLTHFNKGKGDQDLVDRVMGSQAFAALARIVMIAVKTGDGDDRLLARSKSNVGPDDGGVLYRVLPEGDVARIEWVRVVEGDARELMQAPIEESPRKVDEALAWLRNVLAEGPRPADAVTQQGAAAGHAESTLKRAKKKLRVRSTKVGQAWVWALETNTESDVGQGAQEHQEDQGAHEDQGARGMPVGKKSSNDGPAEFEEDQASATCTLGSLGPVGQLGQVARRRVLTDWSDQGVGTSSCENLTRIS